MHKNLILIAKAIAEIQRCEAEGAACAASIERLLRWINEASGRKIRIVSDAA
jgi:hypothetical protein